MEVIKLLLFPLYIVAGAGLSRQFSRASRVVAGMMAVASGVLLLVLVTAGLIHSRDGGAAIHRWTGHGILIFQWLCIPFSIGVVLQQKAKNAPIFATFQALALLMCLAITFLAGVTGYLGDTHQPGIQQEARNRFVILHFIAMPTMLAILHLAWLGAVWPLKNCQISAMDRSLKREQA